MGKRPPARTPAEQEKRMIRLAMECAEKQLAEGTAAPSTVNLYLRMGTTAYQLERQRLEMETRLMEAKAKNLESQARVEELIEDATAAWRRYSGAEEIYDEG